MHRGDQGEPSREPHAAAPGLSPPRPTVTHRLLPETTLARVEGRGADPQVDTPGQGSPGEGQRRLAAVASRKTPLLSTLPPSAFAACPHNKNRSQEPVCLMRPCSRHQAIDKGPPPRGRGLAAGTPPPAPRPREGEGHGGGGIRPHVTPQGRIIHDAVGHTRRGRGVGGGDRGGSPADRLDGVSGLGGVGASAAGGRDRGGRRASPPGGVGRRVQSGSQSSMLLRDEMSGGGAGRHPCRGPGSPRSAVPGPQAGQEPPPRAPWR